MKIELKNGIEFELEPDITVLVGASSMKIWRILHDVRDEHNHVIFDSNAIIADGDELRVVPYLVDKNRWQMALFNCPDAYIHPWRFHKLFEILQIAAQNKRILLTTFNPLFLNLFEPRMVRVVEQTQGGNVPQVKPIDAKETNAAMLALEEDLGELWYRNRIGGNPPRGRRGE